MVHLRLDANVDGMMNVMVSFIFCTRYGSMAWFAQDQWNDQCHGQR